MATDNDNGNNSTQEPGAVIANVGPRLRKERERQGLSEKQVADRLQITMHYVGAIESDEYDKLPGIVFARGYIKSYALLLGLDTDDLIEHFNALVAERAPESRTFIRPGRAGKNKSQALAWLLVAMLAFLAGYLVFWAYNRFFSGESADVADQRAVSALIFRDQRDSRLGELLTPGLVSIQFNELNGPVGENIRIDNTEHQQVGI